MARGVKANGFDLTAGFKMVENGFVVTVGQKTYCITKGSEVTLESILSPHLKGTITKARVTNPRKHAGGRPKGSKNKPVHTEQLPPPEASTKTTDAVPPPAKRRMKKFTTTAVEAPSVQE